MANIQNNSSTDALGKILKNDNESFHPLTMKEERELIEKYKDDPAQARCLLVQHHLRLVFNLAKRYASSSIDFDETMGRGISGLIHAAEKFDFDRNIKFVTYATPWIYKYIVKEFTDKYTNAEKMGISLDSPIDDDGGSATYDNVINHYVEPCLKLPESSLSVAEQLDRKEVRDLYANLCNYVEEDPKFDEIEKIIFQRNLVDRDSIRQISADLNLDYSETNRKKKDILAKLKEYLGEKCGITSLDELMDC